MDDNLDFSAAVDFVSQDAIEIGVEFSTAALEIYLGLAYFAITSLDINRVAALAASATSRIARAIQAS